MKLESKTVLSALGLLALLLAGSTQAQDVETIVDGSNAQLRQRSGQDQRRLFYWGNILYALRVCTEYDGTGWCPEPHCNGPLKPPGCQHHEYSGGSSSTTKSSSSSSGGSSSKSGGSAQYADYQYNEDYQTVNDDGTSNASSGNADDATGNADAATGNRDYSVGTGANGDKVAEASGSSHLLMGLLAGCAVVGVIGAFLMKKRSKSSDEAAEAHELSQSVSKRLEDLLAGKNVPPINEEPSLDRTTSFIPVSAAIASATALPKKKEESYEEPDHEAIEVKLKDAELNGYMQMA